MSDVAQEIADIVLEFLRPDPRLVCICGCFEPGELDIQRAWLRCRNCSGWVSHKMIKEYPERYG